MRVMLKEEWVNDGVYEQIAYLDMTVEEIAQRCRFEPIELDGDYPGKVIGQYLKDKRGNQYYLAQSVDGPSNEWSNRTALHILAYDQTKTRRSTTSLTNTFTAAMQDLKIPTAKVAALHKEIDTERADWILGWGLKKDIERFQREFVAN